MSVCEQLESFISASLNKNQEVFYYGQRIKSLTCEEGKGERGENVHIGFFARETEIFITENGASSTREKNFQFKFLSMKSKKVKIVQPDKETMCVVQSCSEMPNTVMLELKIK